MRFKLLKAQCFEVYQDRSHHHQEEDEMAKTGMLVFLLSGWQENGKMVITRLEGYPKLFIIPVGRMGYHHYW